MNANIKCSPFPWAERFGLSLIKVYSPLSFCLTEPFLSIFLSGFLWQSILIFLRFLPAYLFFEIFFHNFFFIILFCLYLHLYLYMFSIINKRYGYLIFFLCLIKIMLFLIFLYLFYVIYISGSNPLNIRLFVSVVPVSQSSSFSCKYFHYLFYLSSAVYIFIRFI